MNLILRVMFITVVGVSMVGGVQAATNELGNDMPFSEGMESSDIQYLQTALADLGFFKEEPSGHYGASTKEAVKSFQKTKNIPDTGTINEQTRYVLVEEYSKLDKNQNTPSNPDENSPSEPKKSFIQRIIDFIKSLWGGAEDTQEGEQVSAIDQANEIHFDSNGESADSENSLTETFFPFTSFVARSVSGSAPTLVFEASATSVEKGKVVKFTWSSSGATSCRASGEWSGSKPTRGTYSVIREVVGTYTYKLTCLRDRRSVSKQITISVVEATPVTPPDTTPPVISAISSSVTTSGAIISWTTNEAATSLIEYGTTASYGLFGTADTSVFTAHSQSISGLSAGTLYHYRIISKDSHNNTATSEDQTFTTTAEPVPAPAPAPTPTPTPTPTPAPGYDPMSVQLPMVPDNLDLNAELVPSWGTGAIPASAAPDVVGAFRFICNPSHLSYNDPIVYPGQPGKSHLHQFFGNTLADANSTYTSLRTSGMSTCNSPLNRSAYWIPAMLDGQGNVVKPDYVSIYYKRRPSTDPLCKSIGSGGCVNLPRGLRFVFGKNMLDPNQKSTGGGYFNCTGPTAVPGHYPDIPTAAKNCPNGNQLGAIISAPECWDGRNLDSPDHRSHVAYSAYIGQAYAQCPSTHPYVIPTFTLGAWYTTDSNLDRSGTWTTGTKTWSLSSDMDHAGVMMKPGTSFHSDWFGAWNDTVKTMWEDNCVNKLLNCSGGDLGNGKQLKMFSGFTWSANPRLVPMP